jgi:MFS family permease
MYSFVIPTLIATWGITRAEAGALGTAALLASAAGGWLAGWVADRFGRVRTLQVAIAWSGCSLSIGCRTNYQQLFLVRAARSRLRRRMGGGAVLLGEVMRPEHRGSSGIHAGGLGSRLGNGDSVCVVLLDLAGGDGMAGLFLVGILPRSWCSTYAVMQGAGRLPEIASRFGGARQSILP